VDNNKITIQDCVMSLILTESCCCYYC